MSDIISHTLLHIKYSYNFSRTHDFMCALVIYNCESLITEIQNYNLFYPICCQGQDVISGYSFRPRQKKKKDPLSIHLQVET